MAEMNTLDKPPTYDMKTAKTRDSFVQEGSSNEFRRSHQLPPLLQSISSEELAKMNRSLVWKLDMRLMAPLILMYIMNYLDRHVIMIDLILIDPFANAR